MGPCPLQGQSAPRPGDLPALKSTGIPAEKGGLCARNVKVTMSQLVTSTLSNLPSSLGSRHMSGAELGLHRAHGRSSHSSVSEARGLSGQQEKCPRAPRGGEESGVHGSSKDSGTQITRGR